MWRWEILPYKFLQVTILMTRLISSKESDSILEFPGILKQYTKAAIRTQPRDLLLWSAAYFRCLARGEPPLAKDRLEYPVPETDSGEINLFYALE